jgi:hypothetical protein
MLDSTGASGFLPTVTFTSTDASFTALQRITQLNNIGITGYYEANFADNITDISYGAFQNDVEVVVVTINKVANIRSYAFAGCSAMRAITLDTAVDASGRYLLTSIGTNAFQGCTSLRNLHIPDTVKIIPDYMCNLCSSLEVAVMGYGCDRTGDTYNRSGTIGQYAFANCSRLSYFVVPETVANIYDYAFQNDTSLALVYILGRPDVSANAFTSAMGTGATYYFDNSASYTTLTAVTSASLFPTTATKRPYREFTLTATGELSPATVRSTIPATTYWKGKILNSVTSLATSCFAGASGGADIKYPYMVALSLPPALNTIGYGAFINTDGTSGYSSIIGAFYIPNSVTTLGVINATANTFAGLNTTLRDSSTTKQIVFQTGTNTIAFPAVTFKFSSAMAIIAPTATSFGSECFNYAKNVQLYSFFQKNAYTATTRLDGPTADTGKNAFTWNFDKGIAGYTHYLYIPKQITRMAEELFRGITDNLFVTAYHNYNLSTDVDGLGFGYFSYNATVGTASVRFTGTAPTINIIYNYYNAAGLALTASSSIGNNFPLNVLYPSGVKTITNRFASYTILKTVTISDTVTDISGSTFSGCTGLTRLNVSPSSNLTNLGASACLNCTALTTLFIPNSLRGINTSTFSGCTSLASVTYGNNPGIKYIGDLAFYDTTKRLTSIFIPSSVVVIGNQVFITSTATNVNILNTVTFGAGSRLRAIHYKCFGSEGGANLVTAAQYLRDIVLPSSLHYMGSIANTGTTASLLQNTHRLNHSENLIVPSSVEVIPWAFLFADNLTVDISNVYFPRSITNVAGPRIHNGYSVNGVGLSTGLAGAEFYDSRAGSLIYIPSELSTYTGYNATFPFLKFSGIAANNRSRSYYRTVSFTTNPLISLNLSGTVANTTNAATTTQIHADIKEGVIVIGGGTTSIDMSGSIDGSRNLISVNIPSTVTTISANAFSGCNALVYVTFSENSHLTTIGNSAFSGCTMIHDIQLPDTLTTIGQDAFKGCSNLATISIPYNVTSIGTGAFATAYAIAYVATQIGQDIDGEAAGDQSGFSVSLSADGSIIAIGARFNDSTTGLSTDNRGSVRIYKCIGATWTQIGQDIDGEAAGDQSGYSVSLSADGTIVAIGAIYNDGNGSDSGHVRVYQYNGTSTWTKIGQDIDGEALTNWSGFSVSISSDGTIVAIGAWYNDGNGNDSGHVRIYQYNNGSTTWTQIGQDIDGEAANDQSGYSVSISDNGQIVAIGARYNAGTVAGSYRGHVRVYQYNGSTTWTQIGQDIDGEASQDNSGWSVSLSSDGTIVAIGAVNNDGTTGTAADNRGSVRVYKNISGTWTKLGQDIDGEAAGDLSGFSVSLSGDGTILAIGAYLNDGTGANAGQVRIYQYIASTSTWQKIGQDVDGEAAGDQYGYSVSLSKDGNTLAVGANANDGTPVGADRGHVRVFKTQPSRSVRLHQKLYNDISGSLQTYFPNFPTSSFQVVPALQLTNTLNPAKLTISQINNIYIRYRQSQLGDCTFITVSASSGGVLTASDITTALSKSTGLVHLDISTNVTSIDVTACQNNTRIYSIAISKTVTTIGTSAFYGCTNLTYLSFHPDSVCQSLGNGSFYNNNIFDLSLPDSLTTIISGSFQNSNCLTSVCIPKNVTSLGSAAFHNCPKLTAVALPSSLALGTYGTGTYFNINGSSTTGITFTSYSTSGDIAHFKLSDYSMPNGIVQNVIDSAVTYIDHRAYAYYPDITLYSVSNFNQIVTPGPFSYQVNKILMPAQPAALMLNAVAVNTSSRYPIYRSIPDLNVYTHVNSTVTIAMDNIDDLWVLYPGYSMNIFYNLYDEENLGVSTASIANITTDTSTAQISTYWDNQFGTTPLTIDTNNNLASSVLIMYNGKILSKVYIS